MNLKILWVDDDIIQLRSFIKNIEKQGIFIHAVANFEEAISIINQGETIDLFLVDLLAPWPINKQQKNPYKYPGLDFINLLRSTYNNWAPVIILSLVPPEIIQEEIGKFKIFRFLHKGAITPIELTEHVLEGIGYSKKLSNEKDVIENNSPTQLWNITIEATIGRLQSNDRQTILLGLSGAKYIGGPKIIQALTQVIRHAVCSEDQDMFRIAIETLSDIEKAGWFKASSIPEPLQPPNMQAATKPTTKLILGDIVSKDEIFNSEKQGGLTEDQLRDALSSQGTLIYPLDIATTHTAIFGTTGSGKSVTTKRLAQELINCGVPITIIDWHDEYTEIIHQNSGIVAVPPTSKIKPGKNEIPFTWNILDSRFFSPNVNSEIIEDYIEIVIELLGHKELMNLTEPMKNDLTRVLKFAYERCKTPTFKEVLSLVNEWPIRHSSVENIRGRIEHISSGSLGSIFCSETSFDPALMFSKAMGIRVKHLTADHRSAVGLLVFFLLRQAVSHFMGMGETTPQEPVRHVTIIDEAPMVISSNPKLENEVIRMLQETRKFGEGMILVCRNPGIHVDILRETNQKIAHKLDVPQDVSSVANMFSLDSRR